MNGKDIEPHTKKLTMVFFIGRFYFYLIYTTSSFQHTFSGQISVDPFSQTEKVYSLKKGSQFVYLPTHFIRPVILKLHVPFP
jgi:hypothetical protein